ncbi:MAG: hypothetical protein KIT57_15735 [Blastocatellales bacterium]|nr:hypothetical protein [Blastocatellales bacterium]
MRTLFEDVTETANRDDDPKGGRVTLVLWLVAVLSLGGAYGAYYWVTHRKPPEPAPAALSLDDVTQTNTAVNRFNGFIKAGDWEEAQKMISREGLERLEEEKLSLRESLLVERKNDTVVEALLTPARSRTPSTVRLDCAYLFADRSTKIIPLTLVIEDERIVVNSW